jgi:hypothetical protein
MDRRAIEDAIADALYTVARGRPSNAHQEYLRAVRILLDYVDARIAEARRKEG